MPKPPSLISPGEISRQKALMAGVCAHPGRPRRYHIVTYGCQMNAHDSETLSGMLEEMGLSLAPTREEADLVLFNTCCIRDNAERKALGNIIALKEIKKDRPSLFIGVCGCMAQQAGMAQKLKRNYPFIDFSFGPGESYRLPEILLQALENRREDSFLEGDQNTLYEGLPHKRLSPFKAFLNIMYGCDNFCSYCIVPHVRGRERSRQMKDILKEAEALKKDGVKELMLLGQNVNSYGAGLEGETFPKLLHEIDALGFDRLRFMTSNPKDLSDDLIRVMAQGRSICPQLHLPAQSGSNRMLQAMNRRYTRETYLERVGALREALPDIGLSTDLIVGFPGESEEDFEQTLLLLEEARFDSAYTFIFSPRTGTPAAALPERIPQALSSERLSRLIQAQELHTEKALKSQLGLSLQVLAEAQSPRSAKQLQGKTGRGMSVSFIAGAELLGQVVSVKITGIGKNTLKGEIIKE